MALESSLQRDAWISYKPLNGFDWMKVADAGSCLCLHSCKGSSVCLLILYKYSSSPSPVEFPVMNMILIILDHFYKILNSQQFLYDQVVFWFLPFTFFKGSEIIRVLRELAITLSNYTSICGEMIDKSSVVFTADRRYVSPVFICPTREWAVRKLQRRPK